MLLVVGVEANPAVNMMVPHQRRMWKMEGNLGDGGPLGGTMVGVDGMVGTRVVLESSPLRRASRDSIVSVSKQTLAAIDGKGTVGERGSCLVGTG